MTSSNFAPSLEAVLVSEGGFVNNPNDPGGATNKGVTQRVYDAWRVVTGSLQQSVRFIAPIEVSSIYQKQYWNAILGDQLPAGVDYCLFDEAVNSGPVKSVMDLQVALGVKMDGQLGLVTLGALNSITDRVALLGKICDLRLNWLHRLRTWRFFGLGWSNRIKTVRAKATSMVV